jgi:hypothetical protein
MCEDMNIFIAETDLPVESLIAGVRVEVNKLLKNIHFIPGGMEFKLLILKFLEDNSEFLLLNEAEGKTKIMSFSDLKEMFREEFEYWTIRQQKPVCINFTGDFVFIKLVQIGSENFREAEKHLRDNYPTITRLSIDGSDFEKEANLVSLYKIK